MAYSILDDYQFEETIRNSFDYYEKITTHDSSLSTCIFSIVASRIGYHEKALHYFGDSAKLDLYDTHHNTKDGIHTANMGGNYMAIVYGFAGLCLKEEGLFLSPYLPAQWNSYKFSIKYRGRKILVVVDKTQCSIQLIEGTPISIFLYKKERVLDSEVKIEMDK